MAVRLIAIDIDGTLLDSAGHLPDINRQALDAACARGIEIALVTGRSFHHARRIADQMPASVLLILNNGALVKTAQGATLARHLLPKEIARYLVTAIRLTHQGVAVIFDRSDHRQFISEGIDWTHPHRRGYYARNREFIVQVGSIVDELVEDPLQVGCAGSVTAMRTLASRLSALPRSAEFTFTRTEYEHRDFALLDVVAHGCSKGRTLAEWTAGRGLTEAEVMAVGDNLNDREMLEFAGVPVVMGNSVPALKSFGWPQTGTNDAGGLAAAIATFALGGP